MSTTIGETQTNLRPSPFCWNAEALDAFVAAESEIDRATCDGCVESPAVGAFCTANLVSQETVVEFPLIDQQIPGYRFTRPNQAAQ